MEESQNEGSKQDEDSSLCAKCWACGQTLRFPREVIPDGKRACDICFTCGSCQAISNPKGGSSSPSATWVSLKCCAGRILTIIVPLDVLYICIGGHFAYSPMVWAGFPAFSAFSPGLMLHLAISIYLDLQTLGNYAALLLTPPGSPDSSCTHGTKESASDGRFASWSFCHRCEAPRPPKAHHCSTCSRCMLELDHHCIFANTCIGAANKRYFFFFTLYGAMGCSYAFLTMATAWLFDLPALLTVLYPEESPMTVVQAATLISSRGINIVVSLYVCLGSMGLTWIMLVMCCFTIVADRSQLELMKSKSPCGNIIARTWAERSDWPLQFTRLAGHPLSWLGLQWLPALQAARTKAE